MTDTAPGSDGAADGIAVDGADRGDVASNVVAVY